MEQGELTTWVIAGLALYLGYVWYQNYQAGVASATLTPAPSPNPYEGPITYAGPIMNSVIH